MAWHVYLEILAIFAKNDFIKNIYASQSYLLPAVGIYFQFKEEIGEVTHAATVME